MTTRLVILTDCKVSQKNLHYNNNCVSAQHAIIRLCKEMYVCTPVTERRGRVVITPASYSGGPGFKSRPGDRLS
jgi:hypothetical protein